MTRKNTIKELNLEEKRLIHCYIKKEAQALTLVNPSLFSLQEKGLAKIYKGVATLSSDCYNYWLKNKDKLPVED